MRLDDCIGGSDAPHTISPSKWVRLVRGRGAAIEKKLRLQGKSGLLLKTMFNFRWLYFQRSTKIVIFAGPPRTAKRSELDFEDKWLAGVSPQCCRSYGRFSSQVRFPLPQLGTFDSKKIL